VYASIEREHAQTGRPRSQIAAERIAKATLPEDQRLALEELLDYLIEHQALDRPLFRELKDRAFGISKLAAKSVSVLALFLMPVPGASAVSCQCPPTFPVRKPQLALARRTHATRPIPGRRRGPQGPRRRKR
jgi:hypothetical protein